MSRWKCFKLAMSMLWLALAPSKIRKARTGSVKVSSLSKVTHEASNQGAKPNTK